MPALSLQHLACWAVHASWAKVTMGELGDEATDLADSCWMNLQTMSEELERDSVAKERFRDGRAVEGQRRGGGVAKMRFSFAIWVWARCGCSQGHAPPQAQGPQAH